MVISGLIYPIFSTKKAKKLRHIYRTKSLRDDRTAVSSAPLNPLWWLHQFPPEIDFKSCGASLYIWYFLSIDILFLRFHLILKLPYPGVVFTRGKHNKFGLVAGPWPCCRRRAGRLELPATSGWCPGFGRSVWRRGWGSPGCLSTSQERSSQNQ